MATQMTVAQQRRTEAQAVVQTLGQMAPHFKAALPAHVTVEKFTRVASNAIQGNPDLLNADRNSLFQACLKLAADGLMPDGRDAAIVVFGGKAAAMPMIGGILRKIRQSGEVSKVSAQVVHKNDQFTVRYGFDEDVEHIPPALDEPRGEVIGAYATAVLKDGSRMLEVMSLEQIEKVRKVSRSGSRGPWVDWFDEMARKTVMRRLSKRLPMSTDLDVFERDETLAAEPQQVEHAPAPVVPISRLDALEQQVVDQNPTDTDDLIASFERVSTADELAAATKAMHGLDLADDVDVQTALSDARDRVA